MRTAIQVCLFILSYAAAFPQSKPDGRTILKKVGETYQSVSQYELEIVSSGRDPKTKQNVSTSIWAAFGAPDKYRLEGRGPNPDNPDLEAAVMIFDGSRLWAYAPKLNVYKLYDKSDLPGGTDMLHTEYSIGFGVYRKAAENASAKFLREESLAVDGGTRDCFVIVARGPKSSLDLWIDKSTYYVLRAVAADSSELEYRAIKVNEPFPQDRFTFDPPPGARKLDKHDPDPFTTPKKK
jgi:outer membrane lipoprotein-sorting protein